MAAEACRMDSQPFDMRLNETAMAQDVREAALSVYAQAFGEEPDLELLVRRGLLDGKSGRLTNAGVILLARNPGEHIARAGVSVEVRADAQRAVLAKRGWGADFVFDEPLVTMLPVVESHLDELLRPQGDDGYPRYAYREGLVNAVAHRDYEVSGDYTTLSILEGRIEISHAGGPANGLPPESMHETRCPRNPVVARVLSELGWMRNLGAGIRGIHGSMGGAGAHYSVFRELGSDHTKLTLIQQRERGGA